MKNTHFQLVYVHIYTHHMVGKHLAFKSLTPKLQAENWHLLVLYDNKNNFDNYYTEKQKDTD